jgi:hypothetical protein
VASGGISGATLSGAGSAITSLNASNLASGTVPLAQLGSSGTPSATTFLNGANAWATALTSVSVVTANGVSASVATGTTTPALTFTLGAITPTSVAATGAVSGATLSGAGSAITSLNASNLASGTVALARLGLSGTANTTTYLRGDNTWATAVTAVTVANVNGVSAAVSNQGTTPSLAFTLGDITPSSVTSTGGVSGTTASFSGTLSAAATTVTSLTSSGAVSGTDGTFTGNASVTGTLTAGGYAWVLGLTTGNYGLAVNGWLTVNNAVSYAANSVAAAQIDCGVGNVFYKTVTGVNTWTIINPPASGNYYEFVLELTNGGLATQTWFTGTKWTSGVAPTLTASGTDILHFWTRDGGTTWRASAVSIDNR